MKYTILSILLLVAINSCDTGNRKIAATSNPNDKPELNNSLRNVDEKDSIIIIEEPYRNTPDGWDSIFSQFLSQVYEPYFDQKNIHFDCNNCEHIEMTILMKIDHQGKVIENKIISDYIHCNKLTSKDIIAMKDLFLGYFIEIVYPPSLFNKNIEFKIRPLTILKC